jgi:hypothetical protein
LRAPKQLALACTLFVGVLAAAEDPAETKRTALQEERALFPRDFVRGYLDFQMAPPHNEFDLGLCAPGGATAPGATDRCAGFARFMWSGYVELQPFGRSLLRRGFLFVEPKVFGGKNEPQRSYTYSPALILWERTIGVGVELPARFELRVAQHRTYLLGRYGAKPTALTLRPDGPYGLHATVGVRWYFGGYGRAGPR